MVSRTIKSLLILGLLLIPIGVFGANPTYDNSTTCGGAYGNDTSGAGVPSCTVSHTSTSTGERIAIGVIMVGSESATNPPPMGTCGAFTYNSVAMTNIATVVGPVGGPASGVYTKNMICVYKLVNPATGTNNWVANYSRSAYQTESWWGGFATYAYVNSTSSIGIIASTATNDSTASVSFNPQGLNSLLIDILGTSSRNEGSSGHTPGTGQTEIYEVGTGSGSAGILSSSYKASTSTASYTMSNSANSGDSFSQPYIALELLNSSSTASSTSIAYTGSTGSFVVPNGVSSITVTALGAQGGTNGVAPGGKGGVATGTISVTPGETLYYVVGQQPTNNVGGFGGGGNGTNNNTGKGGGGMTWISRSSSFSTSSVLIVGGGGGGGADSSAAYAGGAGGGLTGSGGGDSPATVTGGSQTAGGSVGGSAGQGGSARGNSSNDGGGGGGYYGGGGSERYFNSSTPNGGGGGSSYMISTSYATSTIGGVNSGNGSLILQYVINPYTPSGASIIRRIKGRGISH